MFGFFSKKDKEKLDKGVEKTKQGIFGKLSSIFSVKKQVDDTVLDEIEEILINCDIGVNTTLDIMQKLDAFVKKYGNISKEELYDFLKKEIVSVLEKSENTETNTPQNGQQNTKIILVVGVNGVGKTTTIGKLALRFKEENLSVMIGAADTFRAAAIEQVKVWGERADVPVVAQNIGSDPASVAFDTVVSAKSKNMDIAIIDTAGRLHNKENLMRELDKIRRAIQKNIPDAPHEVLLVLDASTGQNAIQQAKQFKDIVDVSGIVLTKLDGTAKGGVVIAISKEISIPIKYIGLGEKIDDLQVFDKHQFVDSLFSV